MNETEDEVSELLKYVTEIYTDMNIWIWGCEANLPNEKGWASGATGWGGVGTQSEQDYPLVT